MVHFAGKFPNETGRVGSVVKLYGEVFNMKKNVYLLCATLFLMAGSTLATSKAFAQQGCVGDSSMSVEQCNDGVMALMGIDANQRPLEIQHEAQLANYRQSLEILRVSIEKTRARALEKWKANKKDKDLIKAYWVAMRNYNTGMAMYRRHWRRYRKIAKRMKSLKATRVAQIN